MNRLPPDFMDGKDMPLSVGDAVLALSLGAKPMPKRFMVTLDDSPGRTLISDAQTGRQVSIAVKDYGVARALLVGLFG